MAFIGRTRRVLAGALLAAASITTAHAEDIDAKLAAYEIEVRALGSNLPRPNQLPGPIGQRRLIDAQAAYAMGDYAKSSLMLYELATKPGADQEVATFYLAESLYQKGDRGAARTYYEQIAATGNVASKYYQPALLRLIEIAISSGDRSTAEPHVASLERITPSLRSPQVPYVRGKLAFAQGKHDEALAFFQQVPRGSDLELPATYYTATVYVAKQDLQRATDLYTDLIAKKPKTANDRRILELSQLALGRLYYERDQQSKAIDSYLLVDRRSQLFPDALYEVAWVYVKAKQYDKALRALELLALSDPASQKTPTVRILEGNLRIRKAQMVRTAQIEGTLDNRNTDDPEAEYDRAAQVFTDTHDMYVPSYAALAQLAAGNSNLSQYLAQIAGRSQHVFQAAAPLPEAAVQYLRDEPSVLRVVAIEADLGDITTNVSETEATIARLEGVLAAGRKTSVYPTLATRRSRASGMQDELIRLRNDLADQQLGLGTPAGGLATASAQRKQVFASYAAMPSPEAAASEQLAQAQAQYDAVEGTIGEIDDAISATQAMAVAMRKYAIDVPDLSTDLKATVASALDGAAKEAETIENELAAARRELTIGRDVARITAGISPQVIEARAQVRAAQDAEGQMLTGFAAQTRDPARAQKLASQSERASALAGELERTEQHIDGVVDGGLQEVRGELMAAKAELDGYKAELLAYEAEARALGGSVLGGAVKDVKTKFYDIVIRSDVGNVDVSWSQKEDTDDDLKRLNLSRQRELKQLRDEFKGILDAGGVSAPGTSKPSDPKPAEAAPVQAAPEPPVPTGSPDKAEGEVGRVLPGSTKPVPPAAPTVKPDDASSVPKKQPAKTGGKR